MSSSEIAVTVVLVFVLLWVLIDLFFVVRGISRAERNSLRALIDRVEGARTISPKNVLPHGDTQVIDLAEWKVKKAR